MTPVHIGADILAPNPFSVRLFWLCVVLEPFILASLILALLILPRYFYTVVLRTVLQLCLHCNVTDSCIVAT